MSTLCMSSEYLRPAMRNSEISGFLKFGRGPGEWLWLLLLIATALGVLGLLCPAVFAQGQLPGTDASDKLEAAGTLLRILDTAMFKWGARIFAGICVMSGAWSLKEQRFGIAIICIVGAFEGFHNSPGAVRGLMMRS